MADETQNTSNEGAPESQDAPSEGEGQIAEAAALSPKARHEVMRLTDRANRKRVYKEKGVSAENANVKFGFKHLENGTKVKAVVVKKPIKDNDEVLSLEDEVFGDE
jgi:hypothetical protein